MEYQEQLNKLLNEVPLKCISKHIKAFYKELYNYVFSQTQFLSEKCKYTERIYCVVHSLKEKPICLYCKKHSTKFFNYTLGYNKYCSRKCGQYNDLIQENREKVFLERYGVDNPGKVKEFRNKIEQTNIKKYGGKAPLCSKLVRKNCRETCLGKYGVEYVSQSNIAKVKSKETVSKRTPKEKEKIYKKRSNTNLKKYGSVGLSEQKLKLQYIKLKVKLKDSFELLFTENEYKGVNDIVYNFKCKKCGNIFKRSIDNGRLVVCRHCDPVKYSKSDNENEIYLYLKSLNIKCYTSNRKIIYPYELDIYIPSKKIAIEFNGNYWHSEKSGKGKLYHLNKTNLCQEQGIRLIHIFEDEWRDKQQIVKNRLKHILGMNKYKIYGRKCIIKEIDGRLCKSFLDKYHIQGSGGSSVKLGAFYKDRLVAVMTFGKRRMCMGKKTTSIGEYELLRFATVANFSILGIAGKLLKYFERNYNPNKIISYADRRWSLGNLYRQLGFTETHISKPNYWYMKSYINRIHRFNYRKNVLETKLETFDPILTEWENMQANGFDRIWDCGNYVFIKNKL